MTRLHRTLTSIFFAIYSATSSASPWIEPDDFALRADIQLLADTGIIKAPVTTYPLMWQAIIADVNGTQQTKLSANQQDARKNVLSAYQQSKKSTQLSVQLASDQQRFTEFGTTNHDKASLEISQQYSNQYFAGKLSVQKKLGQTAQAKAIGEKDVQLNGSYAALFLGNWLISAGATPRWWGPSADSNLIMSTNARPLPAVTVSRNKSTAFKTPWLNWIGPWTLTAQMASLENSRHIPKTKMWSARGSMRPLTGLELGMSWSFQWGGKGQPNSFADFFKSLSGQEECIRNQTSCDEEDLTTYGNHIAGYDIRWSAKAYGIPYAIYGQTVGEDRSPGLGLITDKADLFGGEIRLATAEQRLLINLEYSNTGVACSKNSKALNCYYEHSTYHSGYRYYSQAIGSTYDNDAKILSAKVFGQFKDATSWQTKLSLIKLNSDNIDRYPNDITMGNSVAKNDEKVIKLDGQYRFMVLDTDITVGASIERSSILSKTDSADTDYKAFIQCRYRL